MTRLAADRLASAQREARGVEGGVGWGGTTLQRGDRPVEGRVGGPGLPPVGGALRMAWQTRRASAQREAWGAGGRGMSVP